MKTSDPHRGTTSRTMLSKSSGMGLMCILLTYLVELSQSQSTFTFITRELFGTTTSTDSRFWSGAISSAVGQNVLQSNNQVVQCLASVSRPTDGNQLRCLSYDSNLLAVFDENNLGLAYGLAVKKNGRIVLAGATSKLVEYQLAQSGATYALTKIYDSLTYVAGTYPSGAVDRPNTVYTYMGPYFSTSSNTGNNQYFHRFESGTNTMTRSSTNIAAVMATGVTADTYIVQLYRETTLISAGSYAAVVFASMTTLDLVLADTSAGAGKTAYGILLDNINDKFLYHPYKESPFTLRKLDISGSTPSVSGSLDLDRPITGLANCGTLNYVLAIRLNSGFIKLYDKGTLADVVLNTIRFKTAPRPSTLIEPFMLSPYTVKVSSAASNAAAQSSFQSQMIYMDYCETRDANSLCTKCKAGYFRNDTNTWNECLMPSQFPSGFGSDIPNNLMIRCKDGCLNCQGDVNICANCDRTNGYLYLFKTNIDVSCVKRADIPKGSGVNVAFNVSQILPCTQQGCLDCTSNKDRCQQCFSFYQLKGGRCDLKSFGLVFKAAEVTATNPNAGNMKLRTLVIRFEMELNPSVLKAEDYKIDLLRGLEVQPEQADIPILSMVLLDSKNGFTITFAPKSTDNGGEYTGLKLSRKTNTQGGALFMSATGDSAFTSPEIYFDLVVTTPPDITKVETTGSVMAEVFNWILKITDFSFRVGLMPIELFVAPIIEKQIAYFGFLKNIDGEFILKPSYVVYWMSSRTFFGFEIKNPHLDWAKTPDCETPEKLALSGLRCDLFTNYGQNLNILMAGLVLSLLTWVICRLLARKLTSPRSAYLLEILRDSFGLRYAASWFDAVSLDLIGLCILNLPYVNKNNSGIDAGFAVSIIILVGYAVYYSAMTYQIYKFSKQTSTSIDTMEAKAKDSELRPSGPYLLAYPLEQYKQNFEFKIFYFTPVIIAVKNIILQVLAISMHGSGWGQILPILTVEFAMFMYLSVSLPKASLIDNLYDILLLVINGSYMAVKIGTTQVAYDRRQGSFGSGLLIIVFGMLYLTTVYVGYKIVMGIRLFIKKMKHLKSLSTDHLPIASNPPKTSENQVMPLMQVKIKGGPDQSASVPQEQLNSSKLEFAN